MKKTNLSLLAITIGMACVGQAGASGYEVWLSDQTNTGGFSATTPAGSNGGSLRIYDGANLDASPIVDAPVTLDANTVFSGPDSAARALQRIHGMLPSPNHRYMNVNFVASGHVGIIDGRTKQAVALFSTTNTAGGDKNSVTGAAIAGSTTGGRQNHMSFWSPDGGYLLLANQNGKMMERVKINWSADGQCITSLVYEAGAGLDLVGGAARTISTQPYYDSGLPSYSCTDSNATVYTIDAATGTGISVSGASTVSSGLTPNGKPMQTGTDITTTVGSTRPNNTVICPIASSDGRHIYATLGGGGMFVIDYTASPMQIVAEYDKSKIRDAGCGGMEGGGYVHLNTGTPGTNKSEFTVYRFPLNYPAANGNGVVDPGEYYPINTPAPTTIYADSANGTTTSANGNRDAHGMGKNSTRSFLHQFDRVQNNVVVFNMATKLTVDPVGGVFNPAGSTTSRRATYSLKTVDGTLPELGGVLGTACGTTPGAGNLSVAGTQVSNDPTPDLLDLSPHGNRMYVALRGVVPLSVGHAASGSCPGLGVVEMVDGGTRGKLVAVLPTSNLLPGATCTNGGNGTFPGACNQSIAGVPLANSATTVNFNAGDNISDPHGAIVRVKD